ncbi:ASN_HP2_G0003170.mRNA.1.CDS.1 [Saccharomyces cerevisiae]|nr:BGN_3a_G0003270.mRNA.1.CDS.1 [Saccharomyces cerevisiae]CAI5237582.1 ASN_HP2_G0003170.mRNA.1.CDS.1 [Saccharomyces cerevisiae]CAI6396100.1 ASN_HP1_G0003210.mRNA.1.CDS.1 [Saccharomyces cerevisiae]CAI6401526.1 ASN_HP2_G0003170.mRNA.1.CDS.1 [Saccharomyces cerevisiae]CAI7046002.1 BGN_3a_G0003270.mRNA.1.CDS.1 [Saccharomyces cerevisiae]
MKLIPIILNAKNLSGMAGSISICCWIVVFVPQIYENFRRQSAEGLSLLFIALWLLGDIFNVMGAMMQNLLPTMIILAAYYTLADLILLIQCMWYDKEKKSILQEVKKNVDPVHLSPANLINETVLQDVFNEYEPLLPRIEEEDSQSYSSLELGRTIVVKERENFFNDLLIVSGVLIAGILSWYISYCSGLDNGIPKKKPAFEQINLPAQILGYLSAILYLGSRIPQIVLNFKRKSCEGVSFLFFLFACLGNTSFIISVLSVSMDPEYLILNASWLIGSAGTLLMDFTVFIQFFLYAKPKYEKILIDN